jgi:hypothetical protein
MRGSFALIALLLCSFALTACDDGTELPEIPVTLKLTEEFHSLVPSTYTVLFSMPNDSHSDFRLTTWDHQTTLISLPEGSFLYNPQDVDQSRDIHYDLFLPAGDGAVIIGEIVSTLANGYICEPFKDGRRACHFGKSYLLNARLERNHQVIGTLEANYRK